MVRVKSFRVHPERGVPDKDIRAWIEMSQEEIGIVNICATLIPAYGSSDPRLNIIITKLDDFR